MALLTPRQLVALIVGIGTLFLLLTQYQLYKETFRKDVVNESKGNYVINEVNPNYHNSTQGSVSTAYKNSNSANIRTYATTIDSSRTNNNNEEKQKNNNLIDGTSTNDSVNHNHIDITVNSASAPHSNPSPLPPNHTKSNPSIKPSNNPHNNDLIINTDDDDSNPINSERDKNNNKKKKEDEEFNEKRLQQKEHDVNWVYTKDKFSSWDLCDRYYPLSILSLYFYLVIDIDVE